MENFNWTTWIVVALAAHTLLKAIATAIDKDPGTDNLFEKIVNGIGNILGYFAGKRK